MITMWAGSNHTDSSPWDGVHLPEVFLDKVPVLSARWSSYKDRDGRVHQTKNALCWQRIEVLAARFWTANAAKSADRAETWHHLLMAVGNFKRQAGMICPPADLRLATVDEHSLLRGESFTPPGMKEDLHRDQSASWKSLVAISGLGSAPTATTLLSALWPGDHVIIDRLDLRMAIALLNPQHALVPRDSEKNVETSWDEYRWFREVVQATADTSSHQAVEIERALFELAGAMPSSGPQNWAQYACVVNATVLTLTADS